MSSIRVSGNTSGYYDLTVPDVAGTNTIALDKVLKTDSNGDLQISNEPTTNNGVLKVASSVPTNYPAMVIESSTGGNNTETHGLYIKNTANGYGLRIDDQSSDTTPFVVDNQGRVGIGTTEPLRSLHISGAGDTGIMLSTTNADANWRNWEIQVGEDAGGRSNLIFRDRQDNGTGGNEVMRLDDKANIGLGTGSPNNYAGWRTITMNGTGTSGGEIDFTTEGVLKGDLFAGSSNMHIRHHTGEIKMYAGGTTANEESIRLQNGTVMHPNMPNFATRINYNGNAYGNGTVITNWHVPHVNQGGHFNYSNGRFTAPYSGSYRFDFHTNNLRNAAGVFYIDWWKNGSNAMTTQGGRIYGYWSGGWHNTCGFVVMNLNANDYVELVSAGSPITFDGNSYGQYTGYMLSTT